VAVIGSYASKAGWYLQNTQAAGAVQFGILAKYIKNNTAPSGAVGLYFKAGNMTFVATSYQWLVVNGSQAVLMGSGTINGKGSDTILISVIDGTIAKIKNDAIRIQIRDNSTQNVVYDTQPGQSQTAAPTTALTLGAIALH
jgi:hypothetical protein